jgi:hypothetical protein
VVKKNEQSECLLRPQLFIPTIGHVTYRFINMLFISTEIFDDKLHPQILLVGPTANSALSNKMQIFIDNCPMIFLLNIIQYLALLILYILQLRKLSKELPVTFT